MSERHANQKAHYPRNGISQQVRHAERQDDTRQGSQRRHHQEARIGGKSHRNIAQHEYDREDHAPNHVTRDGTDPHLHVVATEGIDDYEERRHGSNE